MMVGRCRVPNADMYISRRQLQWASTAASFASRVDDAVAANCLRSACGLQIACTSSQALGSTYMGYVSQCTLAASVSGTAVVSAVLLAGR
jgi:hypothetical protein